MNRGVRALVVAASVILVPRGSASSDPLLADQLRSALQYCAELALPNSMARPPGFDLRSHLSKLQAEFDLVARNLATMEGIAAIQESLNGTRDDLDVFCLVKLAGMTRRAEAQPILDQYSSSSIPGVADIARQYRIENK